MPLTCPAFENLLPTPLHRHCLFCRPFVTPRKHPPKVVDTVAPALHIGHSMSLSPDTWSSSSGEDWSRERREGPGKRQINQTNVMKLVHTVLVRPRPSRVNMSRRQDATCIHPRQ